MSKLAIVTTTLLAAFGGGQPLFAEKAVSGPRCACGLSTSTDTLNGAAPFSDPVNASANERDCRTDGHARTLQTLSRHDFGSSATDARLTA